MSTQNSSGNNTALMEPPKEPRRSSRKRTVPLKLQTESDEEVGDQSASKPKAKPKSSKKTTASSTASSSTIATTSITSTAPGTATSSTTATKSRSKMKGKQAKEKKRTKVGKAQAFTEEELQAVRSSAEEREANINDLVSRLTEEQCRELLTSVAREQPAMVLEIMDRVSAGDQAPGEEPPPPPPARPSPPWCRCGNCHIMQRAVEDQCCGYNPDRCLSNAVEMRTFCLDPHVLNLNMMYRADILAVRNIGQHDDQRAKNKSFRHAAYRQHVLWQHGRLRRGDRRVIASCCVWKIRDTYPDPSGQYIPFQPARL